MATSSDINWDWVQVGGRKRTHKCTRTRTCLLISILMDVKNMGNAVSVMLSSNLYHNLIHVKEAMTVPLIVDLKGIDIC